MSHPCKGDCGGMVEGDIAEFFLSCYRKFVKDCPECTLDGRLLSGYKPHEGPVQTEGRKEKWRPCKKCGKKHSNNQTVKLDCKKCGNKRFVVTYPAQTV